MRLSCASFGGAGTVQRRVAWVCQCGLQHGHGGEREVGICWRSSGGIRPRWSLERALLFEMADITLMALGAGYGRHPKEKGMVDVKNRKCSWLVLATTHGKVC